MLKRLLKCTALVCAMALTFSLCGCSDTSWAVKVGNTTMPSGVYLFWLTQVAGSIEQSTSSGVDPWSQTYSGASISVAATKSALDSTEQCAEIENLCAKMKITASTSDVNSAAAFASSAIAADSATYSGNGISQASVQRVYQDYVILRTKLFNAIYGAGGSQAVSDADLKTYYAANYVRIKHIVILTQDSSGTALTGAALTTANNTAETVYNLAKAKGANFDALMVKYSQDVDSNNKPNEPDGYYFSKTSAANEGFDQTFVDTAFSSKVGEISKIQMQNIGWSIMLKLSLDDAWLNVAANKSEVLNEMKDSDFATYIENQITSEKPVQNTAAINYYKPENLK